MTPADQTATFQLGTPAVPDGEKYRINRLFGVAATLTNHTFSAMTRRESPRQQEFAADLLRVTAD